MTKITHFVCRFIENATNIMHVITSGKDNIVLKKRVYFVDLNE